MKTYSDICNAKPLKQNTMKKLILILSLAFLALSCNSNKPYCHGKNIVHLKGEVMLIYPHRNETKIVVLKGADKKCYVIYNVPLYANACDLTDIAVCQYKGNRYVWGE
jgi:hypothetical protein